jgi:hypothetical protein
MKVVGMNLGSLARAVIAGALFVTAFVACRGNPQAEPERLHLASVDTKSGALQYPSAQRGNHVDQ